jgi:hypothetical protein
MASLGISPPGGVRHLQLCCGHLVAGARRRSRRLIESGIGSLPDLVSDRDGRVGVLINASDGDY